jgi:hypothetical protein
MSAAWVDRLERRLGFLEVPNLALFMAGMNGLCAVLTYVKPEFPAQLILAPTALLSGQVWRALTFVLVPPILPPLWMFLWLILYFSYLSALERAWGAFRFTFYVLLGALCTAAAAAATGFPLGSGAFTISLFLAFARLNPELELLLLFVIPVKMKWLAGAAWALIAWSVLFGGYYDRLSLGSGLLNYFLYFAGEHAFELKQMWRRSRYQR